MTAGPLRLAKLMLVDISPLRESSQFRWLFLGQFAALLSRQLLVVAVPYEVYVRTESSLAVGLVGLVQVAPLVFFSVVGGVIADAWDRRLVLMAVEALMALTCVAFAANAGSDVSWPIFVVVAVNAALNGVESPARTAMIPSLVSQKQISSAFALYQSLNQTMQIVGPALGGVLIASTGVRATYVVAAVGAAATVAALIPLSSQRPHGTDAEISLRAAVSGWRYLRGAPLLQQTMLIDLNAMVFGMPRALFPAIGTVVLAGDASTVGLLFAAPGVGALVGALTTGWVPRVRRQGRAVVLAVGVWGAAIAAFGLSRHLVLSLLLLAVAGAADVVSNVFRSTILQTAVPDGLRGRITSFKGALAGGGPRLGDAEAGAVASWTTPTISVVSGGVASAVGGVLIALLGRDLWEQAVEISSVADAANGDDDERGSSSA